MVRRAIGAVVVLSLAAIVAIWRLGLGTEVPPAAAQTPAPGDPGHRRNRRRPGCPGLPARHRHGASLQHAVAIKSRVDGQIVKVDFKEGQEVKEGEPLIQIDPRPFQAALEQAQAPKQKDEAQLAGAKLDLERYEKLIGHRLPDPAELRQPEGSWSGSCRLRSRAMRRRSIPPSSTSATPIFALRSTGASARSSSTRAISCMRTTTPPLVTITEVKPIFVSFTLPQEMLDDLREEPKESRRWSSMPTAVTARSSSPRAS